MDSLFRQSAKEFSRRMKRAEKVDYERARPLRAPNVMTHAFSVIRNMTFAASFMVSAVHQFQQAPEIRRLLTPAKGNKRPLPPLSTLPAFMDLETAVTTNLHILESCNKKGTLTPTELNVMSDIYDRAAEFTESITAKPEHIPYVLAITFISAHENQNNKNSTHFDHLDNIIHHMLEEPHVRSVVRSVDHAALRGHTKKPTP
jgi:hypothetical protein